MFVSFWSKHHMIESQRVDPEFHHVVKLYINPDIDITSSTGRLVTLVRTIVLICQYALQMTQGLILKFRQNS